MIYIRINKAASTSVSNFVQSTCTILQMTKVTKRVERLGGWLDREKIKNQECFTVVRNPYDRAISMWQHCKRLGNDYTLIEWLEKDFSEMEPRERIHSLRQVDYLYDTNNSLDWVNYVLKLERPDIEEELRRISGAKGKFQHMAKGGYDQAEYYTPYAKELVKSKYAMDFKIFGYEK